MKFKYKVIDRLWNHDTYLLGDDLIVLVTYQYKEHHYGNEEEPRTEIWGNRGYFVFEYRPIMYGEATRRNIRQAIKEHLKTFKYGRGITNPPMEESGCERILEDPSTYQY